MAEFIARILINEFKAAGFLMQPDFGGNRRIGRKSGHSEYQSIKPSGEGERRRRNAGMGVNEKRIGQKQPARQS